MNRNDSYINFAKSLLRSLIRMESNNRRSNFPSITRTKLRNMIMKALYRKYPGISQIDVIKKTRQIIKGFDKYFIR